MSHLEEEGGACHEQAGRNPRWHCSGVKDRNSRTSTHCVIVHDHRHPGCLQCSNCIIYIERKCHWPQEPQWCSANWLTHINTRTHGRAHTHTYTHRNAASLMANSPCDTVRGNNLKEDDCCCNWVTVKFPLECLQIIDLIMSNGNGYVYQVLYVNCE